jgi:hypothetical protein
MHIMHIIVVPMTLRMSFDIALFAGDAVGLAQRS